MYSMHRLRYFLSDTVTKFSISSLFCFSFVFFDLHRLSSYGKPRDIRLWFLKTNYFVEHTEYDHVKNKIKVFLFFHKTPHNISLQKLFVKV